MMQKVHKITGISVQALQGHSLSEFSFDEQMSWAARRKTKHKEDAAYIKVMSSSICDIPYQSDFLSCCVVL